MVIAISIIIVLVFLAVIYFGILRWDVMTDVKHAPRDDMYLCNKHGAFPAKYAIDAPVAGASEPVKLCPMCLEDAEKKATALYSKQVKK